MNQMRILKQNIMLDIKNAMYWVKTIWKRQGKHILFISFRLDIGNTIRCMVPILAHVY